MKKLILIILNSAFLTLNLSAQAPNPIRFSADSRIRYSSSITDSNSPGSIQFVRGDFTTFDVGLFDGGVFRSNLTQYASATMAVFTEQNDTNTPMMLLSVTNGNGVIGGWNNSCSTAVWTNNPPGSFTNWSLEFNFTDVQTSVPLNGQASQTYWLRLFLDTTDSPPRVVTYLEGPLTVFDGPISPNYLAPGAYFRLESQAGGILPQIFDGSNFFNLQVDYFGAARTMAIGDSNWNTATNAFVTFNTNTWVLGPPGLLSSNAVAIGNALTAIGFSPSTNTNNSRFYPVQFYTNGSGQVQIQSVSSALLANGGLSLNVTNTNGTWLQTNTGTGAYVSIPTNGHLHITDEQGTTYDFHSNGVFAILGTNTNSVVLTNGNVIASAAVVAGTSFVGNGADLTNLPASSLVGSGNFNGAFTGDGGGVTNVQNANLDAQTIVYAARIGMNDAAMENRLNRFILALKAAGLYSNLVDGVLLRTNWQSSPSTMVTFFGKTVTNVSVTFGPLGTVFSGNGYLKFPCALPATNSVYAVIQNGNAPVAEGVVYVGFSNADTQFYTYAEELVANAPIAQTYSFSQYNSSLSATEIVSPIAVTTWNSAGVGALGTQDWFRHDVTAELNGQTSGTTYVDGAAYSLSNGTSLTPQFIDTVGLGARMQPTGAGGAAGDYWTGIMQDWLAFNTNLSASQIKQLNNAVAWLDPEPTLGIINTDSRGGNKFDGIPDSSYAAGIAQSSYGQNKVWRRYSFPQKEDYTPNTNWPDLLPQYINPEAQPNSEDWYQFGINTIGNGDHGLDTATNAAAYATNSLAYFSAIGIKTIVYINDPYPTNTVTYPTATVLQLNNLMNQSAAYFSRLIPLSSWLGSLTNTNGSPDGLHYSNYYAQIIVTSVTAPTNFGDAQASFTGNFSGSGAGLTGVQSLAGATNTGVLYVSNSANVNNFILSMNVGSGQTGAILLNSGGTNFWQVKYTNNDLQFVSFQSGAEFDLNSNGNFSLDANTIAGPNGLLGYVSNSTLIGTATLQGQFFTSDSIISSLASGPNADVPPGSGSLLYVASGPSGAFSIAGFAGASAGRDFTLINPLPYVMTILNDSGLESTAANRIYTGAGDIAFSNTPCVVKFHYEPATTHWILSGHNQVGGGGGSGGSGTVTQVAAAADSAGVVSWTGSPITSTGTFTPTFSKASPSQFGVVEVDNSTITASTGVISANLAGVGAALTNTLGLLGTDVTNTIGKQGTAVTNTIGQQGTAVTNTISQQGADVTNTIGLQGANVTNSFGNLYAAVTNTGPISFSGTNVTINLTGTNRTIIWTLQTNALITNITGLSPAPAVNAIFLEIFPTNTFALSFNNNATLSGYFTQQGMPLTNMYGPWILAIRIPGTNWNTNTAIYALNPPNR